jgi:hypothetical protein
MWFARVLSKRGGFGLLLLAAAMTYSAGTKPDVPPVVVEEGIKITSLDVGESAGGLKIEWETKDERIVVGEDEFVVRCRDRQIPSRTGWSAWREVGRTKATEFSAGGFWKSRDIQLRIEVDKGAIAK